MQLPTVTINILPNNEIQKAGPSFAVMDEMMHGGDVARSKRVTDAMLKMVTLDIAALEKVYRS